MKFRGLRSFIHRQRAGFGASAVLLCLLAIGAGFTGFVASPSMALAQDQTTRTVHGKVVDKDGAALKGAIVYLKDSHTLSVKSAVTIDDGTYRFGQLAQNTDYEIWAANGSQKSATKNISSFDNRKEFDITLKIDK